MVKQLAAVPAVVLVGLVPLLVDATAAERRPAVTRVKAPAPGVSPSAPLPGERVTVKGDLGDIGRRAVRLQERQSKDRWVTVDRRSTNRDGEYAFTWRTLLPRTVVRVVAPADDEAPRVRTARRVVTTATEQHTLDLTGDRSSTTVTTTVTPARPGRVLRLQLLGTSWSTVAVDSQTASGTVSWTLPGLPALPHQYRVRAARWRGASPSFSEPVTFAPGPVPSGLPRIYLTTEGGAPIVDRENYLLGTLQVDDGPALPMEVRGRGHGSWVWHKKPYRIKLATKSELLGMPSERDWALLANFADRSLLRTWAAFGIAAQTSLGWTPQVRFVDVSLNGVDIGSYQLVEHVEESAAKVVLADGGLLLEVDTRYEANGDPGFTSAFGTPLGYKDPDDPEPDTQAAVLADVDTFESALYGPDYLDPVTGYAQYVDLESFADWYLVNELMKNYDGDFFSSAFVSWDPAGVFTMGPVWDFDLSSGFASTTAPGCCEAMSGWWLRGGDTTGRWPSHATHWLTRMTTDPAFLMLLEQRWPVVRAAAIAQLDSLATQADTIELSAALDWQTWRTAHFQVPGTVKAADQPGEAAFLAAWLSGRLDWMDGELG